MPVRSALLVGVVVTAAGAVLLAAIPGHAGLVAHVWVVAALALALGVALERLRKAVPVRRSRFDAAFVQRHSRLARPASLARVEREVTLATGTAFDVHYRLRPVVSRIAAGLLVERGVDVDRSPARAEALLAPETWELVRPDRVAPTDRSAPGLQIDAIARVVDDLERVACS